MKLGFIGAGKMATAIAKGILDSGVLALDELIAADISGDARDAFTSSTAVECLPSADRIIDESRVLLLAVKPQCAEQAVAPIGSRCAGKLVISIAAGLTLARLEAWFDTNRIVRVMPNTPLTVGCGASAFACSDAVLKEDRELTGEIFGATGIVFEVPEEQLDAVTAVSGSGPAYIFEMIQGLTDAGVSAGLDPEMCRQLVVQTVAGAAEMVSSGLGTPDQLREAVTSPGGTTAAGLEVFRKAGFRGLLGDVVAAARDRSQELGRAAAE